MLAKKRGAREAYRSATRGRGIRSISLTLVVGLLVAIAAVSTPSSAAAKEDYPTYADVQDANRDVSKKKALIQRIEGLLEGLEVRVAKAEKKRMKAGEEFQLADQAYQEQGFKTLALQEQADAAEAESSAAKQRAGELLVQQYRSSGNTDITLDLLLNASDSDDTLYSLGMSAKLVDQAQAIFDEATQKQNTAQSLSDQAAVAEDELNDLRIVAEKKQAAAAAAEAEAAAALQEQEDNIVAQQELLAAAKATAKTTEAGYQKGVAAREAARLKAEAARQKALAASYGTPVATADPQISVNGEWARPAYGRITDGFGYRANPWGGGGRDFHLGTDIGAACGTSIFAAHGGTVSYSGWNGVYGNFIRIDISNGVQNEYGHILGGGLLVGAGQTVSAGQVIARVGRTGGATGCHLHFGVRIGGLVTDAVPFSRQNGFGLG